VLAFDPDLETLARRADGVVFGTLAQRHGQARQTIHRFLRAAPEAVRLLDLNLRDPHWDRAVLAHSLELATAVKGTQEEMVRVQHALGEPRREPDEAAARMRRRHGLAFAAVTNGADGTRLHTAEGVWTARPRGCTLAEDADPVGAGDACSAGLLVGWVFGLREERLVALADTLGAWTAAHAGACPPPPPDVPGWLLGP
jgi:fructokinase